MDNTVRVFANADIQEIVIAAPEGHQHLRTTIRLQSGETLVLQEATLANLVRGYIAIKTHPKRKSVRLVGQELLADARKTGFADWQLLEDE